METNKSILDPLMDGISSLELLGVMGDDLEIVNDARVSYDRQSQELNDRDIKLIKFLRKHKHNSPLRGCVVKFKLKHLCM